jgi:WD40 repeat protein
MILNGHADRVSAMVVIDELRICSCSNDKAIKLWNIGTGVCEKTLEGHAPYVMDIVLLLDGRICSVSNDCSAKIWNSETVVCDIDIPFSSSLRKVVQLQDGQVVVTDIFSNVYMIG